MSLPKRIAVRLKRLIEAPPPRERTVVKVVRAEEIQRLPAGFIIGVYRSGTTLLRYVLDSHSRITVPPESNFLVSLAELYTSEWNRKGLRAVGLDDDELMCRLRVFVDGIYDAYAVAKGKSRWFDKTPSYVEILEFLDRLFGEGVQYLMLYRHGLDVADSLVKTTKAGTVFAGAAARYEEEYRASPRIAYTKYWVELCEKMLSFEAAHPEQCFRLRYEDYTSEPSGKLKPLFDFIGEPWEDEVLDFTAKTHDFGLQDSKILETKRFQPNIGKYKEWPEDELVRATEIAGPTLQKLGYQV
jgi:hypothetical protein